MTFKEKHLLPLMMAATMLTSCDEVKTTFFKDKNKQDLGLLDKTPQKESDKYGNSVVLYQVNVPVYRYDGKRLSGQYVLTRGLKQSSYTPTGRVENMQVKRVYLNGSDAASFVKADENNAIYTENGFCGLFIDSNKKAVVVADKNITRFLSDMSNIHTKKTYNSEQHRNYKLQNNDAVENGQENSDFAFEENIRDSVMADTVTTDTLTQKNTFTDKQFSDTLKAMRRKEM